jgi:hypothetical protein
MMKLPSWLYLKRDREYDTIYRVGRRPLVYTRLVDKGAHPIPPAHLVQIGRFHLSYGPAEGLTEGLTARTRWHRLIEARSGSGLWLWVAPVETAPPDEAERCGKTVKPFRVQCMKPEGHKGDCAVSAPVELDPPPAVQPEQGEGARPRCDQCHGWLLPDFQVPNHVWAAVIPEGQRDEAWCLRCFDQVATEQRVAWEVEGVSFFPVSGEWWRREVEGE